MINTIKEIIRQNELILELRLDTREKRDAHGITVYTYHCPLCPHPGECPKETCEFYPCNEGYTYPKDFNDLKQVERRLRYWKAMLRIYEMRPNIDYSYASQLSNKTIECCEYNFKTKS